MDALRGGLLASVATITLLVAAAPAPALERKLVAGDDAGAAWLGYSVAIDDDVAVVGAPQANESRGAVYVYNRTGDTWAQSAKLTASGIAPNSGLGTSVAIEGDTIVAGAPGTTTSSPPGAAYTFSRTGSATRQQTGKLVADDGQDNNNLGQSVAIDGDTIVVGAPGWDYSGAPDCERHGAVYTFDRTGPQVTRDHTGRLFAEDAETTGFCFAGGALGTSVDIDGDTIVGGAPVDRAGVSGGPTLGAVYTFTRTGPEDRESTAKLTISSSPHHQLGQSVGIDGPTIVAGAPDNADGGALFTFDRTGEPERHQTAMLTSSFGASDHGLGRSVAIDGSSIVGGAPGYPGGGIAYRFASTGGNRTETWAMTASDRAPNDDFGYAVATDDDRVVVGARRADVGSASSNRGAAYVMTPTVEVLRTGNGTGSVTSSPAGIACPASCFSSFTLGSQVTLTPSASPASFFAGWAGGGACAGTTPCTLTVDGAETETATFTQGTPPPLHALAVSKTGSGQGTVTSSPAGIDCGPDCSESYFEDTQVTLTATPAPGSEFAGWSGGGCPASGPCTVTMTTAQSVSATFNTSGGTGPVDPGPLPPGPTPAELALDLAGKAKQTAEKLSIQATCTVACALTLQARGKADGDKFTSKSTTAQLDAGVPTTVKVKFKRKTLKGIADERGKVTLSATAAAAGDTVTDQLKSKLKP